MSSIIKIAKAVDPLRSNSFPLRFTVLSKINYSSAFLKPFYIARIGLSGNSGS